MSPATITLLFLLFAVCDVRVGKDSAWGYIHDSMCRSCYHRSTGLENSFSGFIDSNVILFVAMFIVGGALFETGMANKLEEWSHTSPKRRGSLS